MKIRNDFVTNSSSSSFIITNTSSESLSAEDVLHKLFDPIIEAAREEYFYLEPGESIVIECGDGVSDGLFENFIHGEFGTYSYAPYFNHNPDVKIELKESHH